MEKIVRSRIQYNAESDTWSWRRSTNDPTYHPATEEMIQSELASEGWLLMSIRREFANAKDGVISSQLEAITSNRESLMDAFVDACCRGLLDIKKKAKAK